MFVDTHCHLEMLSDTDAAVKRAFDAGVRTILAPTSSRASWEAARAFDYPGIYIAIGLHPSDADKPVTEDELLKKLDPKTIAIGETGLDYHYGDGPDKRDQDMNFRAHIAVARFAKLPILIHNRDSDEDMLKLLQEEMRRGEFKAVIHSFTGNPSIRDFALEAGFMISASGIVTFKSADELRQSVAKVPLERMLIETDAPFLAPTPYRGKENEPAFVVEVARCIARLHNLTAEEIGDITTENFTRYFDITSDAGIREALNS